MSAHPLLKRIKRRVKRDFRTLVNADVEVGAFRIEIPSNNPLRKHYEIYPLIQKFLASLVKVLHDRFPRMVAVDIGANVGDTLALIKTGADVPVICIEGDAACAAVLERNSRQFNNTTIIRHYLSENIETASVTVEKAKWNSTLVPTGAATGKSITFATLDSILLSHQAQNEIKLIKVDCEGFDFRILRGGRMFISKQKPALVFELNYFNLLALKEDGKVFLRWLAELGYSRFFVFEPLGGFLFECPASCWTPLDDILDYIRLSGNRLEYVDIVAFADWMGPSAESFRELVKLDAARMPLVGSALQ